MSKLEDYAASLPLHVTKLMEEPAPEPLPDFEPQRTEREILADVACLLTDIRSLLERLLTTERTGAVSSATVKSAPSKREHGLALDFECKAYAGSVVPVEEALDAYGAMVREANERSMRQWEETVK